jgi:hypothetical protein
MRALMARLRALLGDDDGAAARREDLRLRAVVIVTHDRVEARAADWRAANVRGT